MRSCLADPDQRPCTLVEASRGFVVIKDRDRTKPYAWLLVPSTDVTGIEDPAVFEAPVAGFFASALFRVLRCSRATAITHVALPCVVQRTVHPSPRSRPSSRETRSTDWKR